LTATQQHRSTLNNPNVLFDFESESELEKLNWECHKWFEISRENATSGTSSLKMSIPPGRYPGIDFQELRKDWSTGKYLKMDIFNPGEAGLKLHIRIDDSKSGWEYADRFDIKFELRKGMNHISIPADSIRTNIRSKPLNLKEIKRLMVLVPNNSRKRELYIDHIRLE
jgi:hypothetical protein